MRPWVLGDNMVEVVGSDVTDGISGRVSDPVTGAGLFNPNMDPATVGVDPLTGSDAPTGTDMSFGAMVRRQVHTNVINGDFAVLPPGGADTVIVSDPGDADFNPLPGWTWTPNAAGDFTVTATADTAFGSGYKLKVVASADAVTGYLSQLVAVPISQGQQYRVLLSAWGNATADAAMGLYFQFYKVDGTTAIGSEVLGMQINTNKEAKVDAGLVPTNAAYVKVRVAFVHAAASTQYLGEVRCAFPPAEVEVGLKSNTANVGAFSTSETQVIGVTIPAGTFTAGSTYRIRAFGQVVANSSTHTVTIRVRIGTTTLTGNIPASRSPTTTGSASSDPFSVEALVTCRATGAGGTAIGALIIVGNASQPFNNATFVGNGGSTVAVDTTVANVLELTAVTSNAGTTVSFHLASIECVMAS